MQVLHFPTNTGNHPIGLSLAERRMGLESKLVVDQDSWLGYGADEVLLPGNPSRPARAWRRFRWAAKNFHRFDAIHFNAGQTSFPSPIGWGLDLAQLKRAGHKLFMTWQGSDIRPNAAKPSHLPQQYANLRKRLSIRRVAHYCDAVFCVNPDLLEYAPQAEFFPYASVDIEKILPVIEEPNGPLHIVHAPTKRALKGTEAVEHAKRLIDPKLVKWSFVERVSHHEAMKIYRECDVVIDQLKIGWYGTFAVEAMAMGKAVVCFISKSDLARIPRRMADELPIVNATDMSIVDVLLSLASDRDLVMELGRRGRRYVERWHSPNWIARRMMELYNDGGGEFWNDDMRRGCMDIQPHCPA